MKHRRPTSATIFVGVHEVLSKRDKTHLRRMVVQAHIDRLVADASALDAASNIKAEQLNRASALMVAGDFAAAEAVYSGAPSCCSMNLSPHPLAHTRSQIALHTLQQRVIEIDTLSDGFARCRGAARRGKFGRGGRARAGRGDKGPADDGEMSS